MLEFLSNIEKGHPNQKLYVLGKNGEDENDKKSFTSKLEQGDKLLVIAEDGITKKTYNITVLKASELTNSEPDFENSFKVNKAFRTISSNEVKITTNMTLKEFKSYFKNINSFEKVSFMDEELMPIEDNDKLKNPTTMLIVNGQEFPKKYIITVEELN